MTFPIGISASSHVQAGGAPSYGPPEYLNLNLTGLTSFPDSIIVGMRWQALVAGRVTGTRWYHLQGTTPPLTYLWSDAGANLGSQAPTQGAGDTSGFYDTLFGSPILVSASTWYRSAGSFNTSGQIPFASNVSTGSTNLGIDVNGKYSLTINTFPDQDDPGVTYYFSPIFEPQT